MTGELFFERHALIRRSLRHQFRLDTVKDIRLRVSERPALTKASVGKFLEAALRSSSEGEDLESWSSQEGLERQLWLRIRRQNDRGDLESIEEKLTVDGVTDFAGACQLMHKVGTAAGFDKVQLYSLPGCGLEWQMRSGPGPASPPSSVPEDLREIPPPPFVAGEFISTHRVKEWLPGERVCLRRPWSMGVLLALVVTVFFLAVAAFYLNQALSGEPSSRVGHLIVMGVGFVFGSGVAWIAYKISPNNLIVDWTSREIRIESWLGKKKLVYGDISRLELLAQRIEGGGGDGGGGSPRYLAVLQAVSHPRDGKGTKIVPIVATQSFRQVEKPLWMALPLLYELAAALGVEARFLNDEKRRKVS